MEMKTLIVYYSKSGENWFDGKKQILEQGNNEIIANYLLSLTDADTLRLEMKKPYSDNYDSCCEETLADQKANRRPELKEITLDISSYDVIYLVYPIYWANAPMPVFTFLESYSFKDKIIYPICSHEGSSFGSSLTFIRKACPDAKILDPLQIPGSLVHHCFNRLKNYVESHR